MESIEAGALQKLVSLETLKLDYNSISAIRKGMFVGLTNLKTLDLSYNRLTSIEDGAFSDLVNLTELLLFGVDLDPKPTGSSNTWGLVEDVQIKL